MHCLVITTKVIFVCLRICVHTDIDECELDNGRCDHNCTNTNGSYHCSCHHGYDLQDDQHSCAGKLRHMLYGFSGTVIL